MQRSEDMLMDLYGDTLAETDHEGRVTHGLDVRDVHHAAYSSHQITGRAALARARHDEGETTVGTIQIPELYCPFAPAVSPHVEAVQELINQWMQERHYLRTGAAFERFKAAQFALLTGRVHPYASFESILLVASYM